MYCLVVDDVNVVYVFVVIVMFLVIVVVFCVVFGVGGVFVVFVSGLGLCLKMYKFVVLLFGGKGCGKMVLW